MGRNRIYLFHTKRYVANPQRHQKQIPPIKATTTIFQTLAMFKIQYQGKRFSTGNKMG